MACRRVFAETLHTCRKLAPSTLRSLIQQQRYASNLPEHTVYTGPVASTDTGTRVTLRHIAAKHSRGEPISMVTAYDYPSAVHVDRAGIDMLLVGDSVGMVVHGHDTTLPVTLDEMIVHCRAVSRGASRPLLVGDLPFGTYERSPEQAVESAVRLLKEGNVDAVKLEGGSKTRVRAAQAVVDSGIAVMGHVGLTPQSISALGGFRPQGRTAQNALEVVEAARNLEAAGCFAIVLECVPAVVAAAVTRAVTVPTIGIGAGPHVGGQVDEYGWQVRVHHDLVGITEHPHHLQVWMWSQVHGCGWQVLVYHDLVGIMEHPHYVQVTPKFCKQFANVGHVVAQGLADFRVAVEQGEFPGPEHTPYAMKQEEIDQLHDLLEEKGYPSSAALVADIQSKDPS